MAEPFFVSSAGVRHYWKDEQDGSATIISCADVGAALERNKAMANHNDGYTPSRELRRVAFIPAIIAYKWLSEEGWNVYDPEHSDRLARKLNDPDYAFLRTAPGRVGVSNGVMR
jgi:hypothetical protein